MQAPAALAAAREWRDNIAVLTDLSGASLPPLWLPEDRIAGYELAPLNDAGAIIAEARAMKHCVRTHAMSVAHGGLQLWSIRKDGERVATLALGWRSSAYVLDIVDLRGAYNAEAPRALWLALSRRLGELEIERPERLCERQTIARGVWNGLWRAYWLEKRMLPAWLPLTPDPSALWRLI